MMAVLNAKNATQRKTAKVDLINISDRVLGYARQTIETIKKTNVNPAMFPLDTIKWYEALTDNHAGDAANFARLFVIPGMNHCSGGCATDQFDALTALIDWVENGEPPDELIASINEANTEIPVDWGANRTRPLCVWPKIATYLGEGDIDDAASFACAE